MSQSWFVVDKEGLRKTMSRKGKSFAIYELLQNGFDEESTKVTVTLTQPKKGMSVLTCTDDSPNGYTDLSHAHTMFAESKKKSDEKKRGRFNVGEKHVLALCDSATITSTTGRVLFLKNGTRRHYNVKTKVGTEFRGELPLSQEDFDEMTKCVRLVIPPIPTFFNGEQIPSREVLHKFDVNLPTEIADAQGISRLRNRKTTIRLFKPFKGEKPMLYEMGMPVVEIDCLWHVDIGQKVPLNIERDNVTPSYLKAIFSAILEEKGGDISDEEASAAWVTTALENTKVSAGTVKKVFEKRFGEGAVVYDQTDIGANKEATAAGRQVVPRGAMTPGMRKNVLAAGVRKAGEEFSTKFQGSNKVIPEDKMTASQKQFRQFIQDAAPLVLPERPLKGIKFVNDNGSKMKGCTQWLDPKGFEFTVNVAHQDVDDWADNYSLFIHELAHFFVQRNDHLFEDFWRAVDDIGGRLVKVALEHPELFPKAVAELLAA